jgi:hypothetical protein
VLGDQATTQLLNFGGSKFLSADSSRDLQNQGLLGAEHFVH